ncbi:MAG: hypothetical protein IV086_01500 [Hyphomonadaceae bacterium]|nr:MAG: hypothetical protein FD160_3075 [Caulobacteraceae bacterium]MBT9444353.1 hypothetical protein [Hyphomonadaceae bacterium]TPW06468.1 MAG: hypothetical protein FD124_1712 [Alphaproteobacteria bacterium]
MELNIALWAAVYAACFLPQRQLRENRRPWLANVLLFIAGLLTAGFPFLFVVSWALIQPLSGGDGGGLIMMMFAVPMWLLVGLGFAFGVFKSLQKPAPEPVQDPLWLASSAPSNNSTILPRFQRLIRTLCEGWGFCGCIADDGSPRRVNDYLPNSGEVSALQFADWLLLAEWPGDHSDPAFEDFRASWREKIAAEFRRVLGADSVDASTLHPPT